MFIGLEAQKHSIIHQGDVIGAILQAKTCSRVLVILNKYYGVIFPEFADYCGKTQDCRDWLKSVGFVECPTCLVLFSRTEKDGSQVWLILYVDDFLYFGTTEKTCKKFELEFGSRFRIKFPEKSH